MERDFTYEAYTQLIDAAEKNGYEVLPVREYLASDDLPERFLVMRHDVDRKVENALDMARIEADAGVSTSYYFRAIEKVFEPGILREVEALGHEVGYHYEDLDTADGDLDVARHSFEYNLNRFRDHVTVDTVSMHGNPLTAHDNRDIADDIDFQQYDLTGEVYLSVDFSDVVYFSDTNRTWDEEKTIVNDWPVGTTQKPTQITSTAEFIDLLERGEIERLYALVHPNRWAESYAEWVVEYSKDMVTNGGKWGLWAVRSLRGRERAGDRRV